MALNRINSDSIADGTVIAADVADNTITAAKLVSGVLPSAIANSAAIYANGAFTASNTAVATNITQNNSITAAFAQANTASATATAARSPNRIINGGMTIDQRNSGASVTASTTSGAFPVDRFVGLASDGTGTFTLQQSTTTPAGFKNAIIATVGTTFTPSGSNQYNIRHNIEGLNVSDLGWGTANAQPVTLSFWVRSSITGTYGGSLSNSAFDRSYPFTFVINSANTYEYKTITIAGDTSGTWLTDNGIGIRLCISLGAGSTLQGTAGAWGAVAYTSATGATNWISNAGATFFITGVQLEKGSTATPFEFRSIGTELALCQRYLPAFLGNGNWFGFGLASSTTQAYATVQYPVPARVAPTGITVSAASDFVVSDAVAVIPAATSIVIDTAGPQRALLFATTASATLTAYRPTTLASNSANAILLFTGCEL